MQHLYTSISLAILHEKLAAECGPRQQKKTGLHPCTPEKVIKKVLKKKQQKQLVGKESLIWYYQV
jgi:hypothetical protein